jgi:5-methylcytosine-specific restriction endonuclease McrA
MAPASQWLGAPRSVPPVAGSLVLALPDGDGERVGWFDALARVDGRGRTVGTATTSGAVVTRVLLLNATFEPLQLVSERRAVVLMLAGRAEPIVTPEHPSVCRSASVVVEIPAIVRLHDMVKLPSKVRTPPLTRRSLLLRDSYRCAYCLEHADTIDHVVPRSRGGRHEWTNVVAACRHHNMQKGDRLLEEIGWRMHFEPRVPDGPWWRWRHLPDPDPLWAPYLPRAS